jgi:antitoxin HicB
MGGKIGSSFDDFLKEEGIYEAVTARAKERVLARQRDASASRDDTTSPHPDAPRDKA